MPNSQQMSRIQSVQEDQYDFPYHHLVGFEPSHFHQVREVGWGYEYASYLEYILERLKGISFERLCDIGCGDGKFLREANKAFPTRTIEGIDYSEHAAAFARAFNPTLTVRVADVARDTLDAEPYQVATLIETLEHIPPEQIGEFLQGIHRLLDDDGTLIVTVPSTNVPVSTKHYQHFDLPALESALAPFFSIVDSAFLNRRGFLPNRAIRFLLSNRLLLLKSPRLATKIYSLYKRFFLDATERTGSRVFAVCRKLPLCGL